MKRGRYGYKWARLSGICVWTIWRQMVLAGSNVPITDGLLFEKQTVDIRAWVSHHGVSPLWSMFLTPILESWRQGRSTSVRGRWIDSAGRTTGQEMRWPEEQQQTHVIEHRRRTTWRREIQKSYMRKRTAQRPPLILEERRTNELCPLPWENTGGHVESQQVK